MCSFFNGWEIPNRTSQGHFFPLTSNIQRSFKSKVVIRIRISLTLFFSLNNHRIIRCDQKVNEQKMEHLIASRVLFSLKIDGFTSPEYERTADLSCGFSC